MAESLIRFSASLHEPPVQMGDEAATKKAMAACGVRTFQKIQRPQPRSHLTIFI